MAYQMIYTSMKSGLVAGRSGFCVAARHREIPESLVSRIEDYSSQFERGSAAIGASGRLPVVYSHRLVTVRDRSFHLLMRTADAGNDYSGRTNHIAHSIVLEPEEVSRLRITPAEAILELIQRGTWRDRYEEAPRFFDADEAIDFRSTPPTVSLPAKAWEKETGSAATAALLFEPAAAGGVGIVPPEGNDPTLLLRLFAEGALLQSPDRGRGSDLWNFTFTTLLQSAEHRSEFSWHGCVHNSPLHLQELKGNRYLIELSPGLSAPANAFADVAMGQLPAREVSSGKPGEEISMDTVSPDSPGKETQTDAPASLAGESESHSEPASRAVTASIGEGEGLPSMDLLGERAPRRRSPAKRRGGQSGKLIGAGVLVVLLVILLPALWWFQPVRQAERALTGELKQGDWEGAIAVLAGLEEEQRGEFVNRSPGFAKLDSIVTGYKRLRGHYTAAISHTGDFVAAPGFQNDDPLRRLSHLRQEWESGIENSGIAVSMPPHLDALETQANETVSGYFRIRKMISEIWTELMALEKPRMNLSALRQQVHALDTEADGLLDQLDSIEAAVPLVESFLREKARKHVNEPSRKSSEVVLAGVNEQLATLQSKDAGKPWGSYLARIRTQTGSFVPKLERPGEVIPGPVVAKEPGKKEPDEGEGKKVPEPPFPPVYLIALEPGAEEFSYAGIPPLSEGLPDAIGIVPASSWGTPPKWENGLTPIGGSKAVYYTFPDNRYQPVVAFDEGRRVISTRDHFAPLFGRGFFLGFGVKKEGPPDFLLVAQVTGGGTPDESGEAAPYFYRMPMEKGLTRETEGSVRISLNDAALSLLRRISFPGEVEKYEFVRGSGENHQVASGPEPRSLHLSLLEGLEERMALQEGQMAEYEALREASATYQSAFGSLGTELFRLDEDGRASTVGLKVVSVPQGNRPPAFQLAPAPDDIEKLPDAVSPTLEAYQKRSADFITGPPLFHYLSRDIRSFLNQNGLADATILTAEERGALDAALSYLEKTEEWNRDSVAEAIRRLGHISEMASAERLRKLAVPNELYRSQEDAERARKRLTGAFRADQVVTAFFEAWARILTPDNLRAAGAVIAGGSSGFNEEELSRMKQLLDSYREQIATVADQPLAELGPFYLNAHVVSEGGDAHVFRVLGLNPTGQ